MYYIKNGLSKKWHFLATLYAILGILTVFGTGHATQVNTIVASIDSALVNMGLIDQQRPIVMLDSLPFKDRIVNKSVNVWVGC